jgi:hypothetical protein
MACQCLLIIEASRSHSGTPHSVGLLWTSDQPDSETSTWKYTTLTRDRHPCSWLDSNPQSQQASGLYRAATGIGWRKRNTHDYNEFIVTADVMNVSYSTVGSGIVGIATSNGVDRPGFESRSEQEIFSSAKPSGSALGPTQPPVQRISEFFPGTKAVGAWRWPRLCRAIHVLSRRLLDNCC